MKKNNPPVKDAGRVRLSGVVTAPYEHSQNEQWKEILIGSFVETRFKNVLARATVLPRVDWFWHQESSLHLCEEAAAIIADNANDYRQILIKHNQLASTLPDLDPVAEVLLLVSPSSNFVFGTVLETLEMFSTHILFVQKEQQSRGETVQECLRHSSGTKFSIAPHNWDVTKPTSKVYANSAGGCI
ncbi:hypothetical protein H6G76_33670 [Nostoc sp. FACHB-152]|uniref:hypothetical protein n=1 Tax=Nostoc sp. FACHB-152 TaxID=2692837 RepID=UPI001687A40E|nr:hypothetical protein [Nostoc sp. FACHB-152]MBD2451980.1 hypothetical protein [Nostoc sp. FACHB-152]